MGGGGVSERIRGLPSEMGDQERGQATTIMAGGGRAA